MARPPSLRNIGVAITDALLRGLAPFTLTDGVYLRLPEWRYFDQPRLGSTDLVKLLGGADWWYQSRHNPAKEEREGSDERDFGRALHTLILEGDEAYEASVVIKPTHYPTPDGLKPWNGNAAFCKAWAERIAPGATVLPEAWAMRVRHMAALILNHPQYKEPLRSGLAEVSVLFTHDGQPMRARLDYLLPRWVLDLKSYGGHSRGDGHMDKALRIVAERNYDVQRFLYDRAREAMIALIDADLVFGATDEERAWLAQLARETDWGWVWLFYQRRDDRIGRAPVVLPIHRPRFDITFDTGREKVEAALANYRRYVARFGLETPWADVQPMRSPDNTAFPPWLQFINREPEAEEAA